MKNLANVSAVEFDPSPVWSSVELLRRSNREFRCDRIAHPTGFDYGWEFRMLFQEFQRNRWSSARHTELDAFGRSTTFQNLIEILSSRSDLESAHRVEVYHWRISLSVGKRCGRWTCYLLVRVFDPSAGSTGRCRETTAWRRLVTVCGNIGKSFCRQCSPLLQSNMHLSHVGNR